MKKYDFDAEINRKNTHCAKWDYQGGDYIPLWIADMDFKAPQKIIDAIKDMKKRYGIGDYIPEIQETDIPELAHYADKEANPLYPVPVLMDAGELETLYYRLMPPAGNC